MTHLGINTTDIPHFAGLKNSFIKPPEKDKQKTLLIAFGAIIIVEIAILLFTSYSGSMAQIDYTNASIDLGDFRPPARRAPVPEFDEVFGNQFVKEKTTEPVPSIANEMVTSIDGEAVTDLDVQGAGGGARAPDIGRCAVRNFPPEAQSVIDKATVHIVMVANRDGIVRNVKVEYVQFDAALPPDLKKKMTKLFESAAVNSLLGRKCPLHRVNGEPVAYALSVPLSYELN